VWGCCRQGGVPGYWDCWQLTFSAVSVLSAAYRETAWQHTVSALDAKASVSGWVNVCVCVCGSGIPYVMGQNVPTKMAISKILVLWGIFLSLWRKQLINLNLKIKKCKMYISIIMSMESAHKTWKPNMYMCRWCKGLEKMMIFWYDILQIIKMFKWVNYLYPQLHYSLP